MEWTYLKSKEVRQFKETTLKLIRNEGSFHIDPRIIESFIQKHNRDKELVLWYSADNVTNRSPFALSVIEEWMSQALVMILVRQLIQ